MPISYAQRATLQLVAHRAGQSPDGWCRWTEPGGYRALVEQGLLERRAVDGQVLLRPTPAGFDRLRAAFVRAGH